MPQTIEMTETLEVTTCWCGAPMALPRGLLDNARRNGTPVYCPGTGHTFVFGDTEVKRLRRKVEAEQAARQAAEDQLAAATKAKVKTAANLKATKAKLATVEGRVANGVCPCCGRSFVQLSRHMKTKHPEYVEHEGAHR